MLSSPAVSVELCKAIAFSVSGYWLALPVASVIRVLPMSESSLFSHSDRGFTYIDGYPTVVLDLHPLFGRLRYGKPESESQFVAIARLDGHSLCAIPIDEPPTLLDIPLGEVGVLPQSYRQSLERVASHIVNVSQNGTTMTIFLLDLQGAMQALSDVQSF
jgi:chemotaxis signal transduction protein